MATRPDPPPDEPTLRLVARLLGLPISHPAVAPIAAVLPGFVKALGDAVGTDQGYGLACVEVINHQPRTAELKTTRQYK